jgi:hypothetical protein
MRVWARRRRVNNCSENSSGLGARASSTAGVFKNRAVGNKTKETASALLRREAVCIGLNPAGETPALPENPDWGYRLIHALRHPQGMRNCTYEMSRLTYELIRNSSFAIME